MNQSSGGNFCTSKKIVTQPIVTTVRPNATCGDLGTWGPHSKVETTNEVTRPNRPHNGWTLRHLDTLGCHCVWISVAVQRMGMRRVRDLQSSQNYIGGAQVPGGGDGRVPRGEEKKFPHLRTARSQGQNSTFMQRTGMPHVRDL